MIFFAVGDFRDFEVKFFCGVCGLSFPVKTSDSVFVIILLVVAQIVRVFLKVNLK